MNDLEIWKTKTDNKLESFDKEFTRITGTMQAVRRTVNLIKDNDLVHQGKDIRELKVKVEYHGKLLWYMLTVSVSTLIGIIFLILK